MDMGIRGRRAIVNGGSAGMGLCAAQMLAAEGVHLVMSARGGARLESAASQIRETYGVEVIAVAADHATAEGRARILDACPEPDILVATCSPPPMTPDHRAIMPADWQGALDTGLLSPVQMIEAVLPAMVRRRWGRIVNIASISGVRASLDRAAYGTSKAAVIGLTRQMAVELARFGITANAVAPGATETEFVRRHHPPEIRAAFDAATPDGRYAAAEEVAETVAFLASEAAGHVNGVVLPVDGGFLAAGVLDATASSAS